ncbi:MAG: division/cell wall cluster transcriptional repressor MraZ [Chloroflexi bacterium]|nr:division/cell wall cluster transcriptional repressor MraZ [Chloroflexota bacterium]MBT7082444.1 division/cell wall cluster transcriptional repressor MraZ [Chloroflexota bacterium]MBT7290027.1 division/cell wall cluster transcriptional repressor MraZ [Chloroflexota bacterium]
MFFGEYEYTIDQKGRVTIPPKFREAFKGGIVLSRGYDKCITACTVSEWDKRAEQMSRLPMTQSKARRLNRATFSSAFSLDLDGQGRIILPAPLRDYAGIANEVVVAGVRDSLEIWSKQAWAQEQEMMSEQVWQIAESIEDRT